MTAIRRREFVALAGATALAGCAVPAAPNDVFRVSFGSCTDQSRPQPIWDTILEDRADVFLFGGDNVYANSPFTPEGLREAYAKEAAVEGFARLRDSVPHMEIWDDGDYGLNDGGAEFAHKQVSKDEFLKFWRAGAGDARRTREGLYDARVFGPAGRRVQVVMLDTRWFRSPLKRTDQRDAPGKERYVPDPDPSKTMLGAAQWAWLEAQLRRPAEVRLLFSGVQVVAEGHGWERWGNLPLERQKLYDLVRKTRANGVVFLSGDRHIGAIYRETQGVPYPLHELTASGFTHTWQGNREAGPNRIGDPFTDLHFGSAEVDWRSRRLELSIKNIRGGKERVLAIPLNQLEIPA